MMMNYSSRSREVEGQSSIDFNHKLQSADTNSRRLDHFADIEIDGLSIPVRADADLKKLQHLTDFQSTTDKVY